MLAVAVLIGAVWFLASRSSRSSAGQEPSPAAVTGPVIPTLTGVLAASTAVSTSGSSGASGSAAASGATPSGATTSGAKPSGGTPSGSPASGAAASGRAKTGSTAAATSLAATPAATATSTPKPSANAAPKPPAGKTAKPTTPKPTSPTPKPSYAPDGAMLCPDAAVVITAISTAPTFTVGSQPMLGMTVKNSGAVQCRRDVSGTLQTFTVQTAGGKRVWSTADCFPGEGTDLRDLAPDQTVQYTVKWSGRASAPGCAGDRAQVPAGKYVVIAQLGKLSSKPAAFTITP